MEFDEYAKQGKNYEYVKKEFTTLKEFLEKFQSSDGKTVEVFLQGSYKNDTNIDKDSDIDIVVLYKYAFGSNISERQDKYKIQAYDQIDEYDVQRYNNHFSSNHYSYSTYKNELKNYLLRGSKYEIIIGDKTIKCKIPNTNFTFDIVCVFQYRFYKVFYNYESPYIEGNLIKTQSNSRIINFPKQTYQNSVNKNKNHTNGLYKETIRIFKNIMKNQIDKQFWIPSFGLESIIFNVPHQYFLEKNRETRVNNILNYAILIVKNHWETLIEPNNLLFIKNMGKMSLQKVTNLLILMQKEVVKSYLYKNV